MDDRYVYQAAVSINARPRRRFGSPANYRRSASGTWTRINKCPWSWGSPVPELDRLNGRTRTYAHGLGIRLETSSRADAICLGRSRGVSRPAERAESW